MTDKVGIYQIPFDKSGNQLDYNDYKVAEWRDNFVFEDTLTFSDYGRGRSSVTFVMKRTDGTTVSMFISDFTDAILYMVKGKLTGYFTFVKKGQNYGCAMLSNFKGGI